MGVGGGVGGCGGGELLGLFDDVNECQNIHHPIRMGLGRSAGNRTKHLRPERIMLTYSLFTYSYLFNMNIYRWNKEAPRRVP